MRSLPLLSNRSAIKRLLLLSRRRTGPGWTNSKVGEHAHPIRTQARSLGLHARVAKQRKQPASLQRVPLKSGLCPDWPAYRASRPGRPTRYSSARADVPCGPRCARANRSYVRPASRIAPPPAPPGRVGAVGSSDRFAREPSGPWPVGPRTATPRPGGRFRPRGRMSSRLPLSASPSLGAGGLFRALALHSPSGALRPWRACASRLPIHRHPCSLPTSCRPWPGSWLGCSLAICLPVSVATTCLKPPSRTHVWSTALSLNTGTKIRAIFYTQLLHTRISFEP